MIEVRTLGAAEIVVGRKRLTPKTEGLFALAVYLCVRAGEPSSRDALCEMFWPGSDPVKARHNLRQMLYRLRQAGIETLEDGDLISIPASSVRCDLTGLAEKNPALTVDDYSEQAATFLPHFDPQLAGEYARWLEQVRASVATRFRAATLRKVALARSEGRWPEVERLADLLLLSDPLNEEGTLAKAESIAMTGSKAIAVELLDRYVDELGDLSNRIAFPAMVLRRRITDRVVDRNARSASHVPLVGRAHPMRRLTALIEQAVGGNGGSLVLHGAPGIGKSRLCEEISNYAILKGFRAVAVRADDARADLPLGLAVATASAFHDLPGAAAADPAAMALVRRLVENATSANSDIVGSAANISLDQIAWALATVALSVAEEGPVFVHFDDLHNADPASLVAIQHLLALRHRAPLVAVGTARSHWIAESSDSGAGRLTAARIHIPPLTLDESRELAASFANSTSRALSAEDGERLALIGGGNPLFIKELTAHTPDALETGARTLTLTSLIEERCALLSQSQVRLLRLILLLGPFATPPRLFALSRAGAAPVSTDVEALENDGLLSLSTEGILGLHECWREAVDHEMPRATRAALAYECAHELTTAPVNAVGPQSEWHLGHLFSIAGSRSEAIACFSGSGARLVSIGLPALGAQAFTKALDLANDPSDVARISIDLAAAQLGADQSAAAVLSCQAGLRSLPRHSENYAARRAEAIAILAEAKWRAHNGALEEIDELLALSHDRAVPAEQRHRCANVGIRIACNHDRSLAKQFLSSSHDAAVDESTEWLQLWTQLIFEAEFGTPIAVRLLVDRLSSPELPLLVGHNRAVVLRHAAVAMRIVGDVERAVELARSSVAVALDAGVPSAAASAALGLAFGYLDAGVPEEAKNWIDRAQHWSEGVMSDERDRALRHAAARYLTAVGQCSEAVRLYSDRCESVFDDVMSQRRAVESACIALAAAQSGNRSLALRALETAEKGVRESAAHWALDSAADSVVAALRALGFDGRADALRADYLVRRTTNRQGPIASAFLELRRHAC
ncbi:MAG: AAA family ATPase [Gemmatimonadetes bacterium]|nr:AAA family ATPase [Gemmatimonadota bacterium]